jgi:hypothetical protein
MGVCSTREILCISCTCNNYNNFLHVKYLVQSSKFLGTSKRNTAIMEGKVQKHLHFSTMPLCP